MPQSQQPNPWRYAHLGLELAGAIVVLALVGLWIDYRWDTGPWGVLVGVLIGAVGGLYLFIKDALAANRQFSYERFARKGPDAKDGGDQKAGDPDSGDQDSGRHASDKPREPDRPDAPGADDASDTPTKPDDSDRPDAS